MEIIHPYLDQIIAWASREKAIRAVVITGSLARGDGSTDAYSDLDAQIITTDINRYTSDDSWLDTLGEVWIRFPLGKDVPYRLVWFEGGIKVDFQFIHFGSIRAIIQRGELSAEYQRGYIVALDKDGLYLELPPSPRIFPAPAPPSADEVEATINEFWFEAIHVAQFIRRRDFWVVKYRDWTMKANLLQILEWRAHAIGGTDVNTWLLGKRILEWTDEATATSFKQIWTGWDAAELWRGLLLQLELFGRLSHELAAALGYQYASETQREIVQYIRNLWLADEEARAKD